MGSKELGLLTGGKQGDEVIESWEVGRRGHCEVGSRESGSL